MYTFPSSARRVFHSAAPDETRPPPPRCGTHVQLQRGREGERPHGRRRGFGAAERAGMMIFNIYPALFEVEGSQFGQYHAQDFTMEMEVFCMLFKRC